MVGPTSDQDLILLVEDDEDQVLSIRRSFWKARVLNPLHVVRSGEEAIEYLGGTGRYSNRPEYPLPAVVLLDLKLVCMDGFEMLRWIRQRTGLEGLRVVVLTLSNRLQDMNLAYQLGANSFLVKPMDLESLIQIMNAFRGYWLWMKEAPEALRTSGTIEAHRTE